VSKEAENEEKGAKSRAFHEQFVCAFVFMQINTLHRWPKRLRMRRILSRVARSMSSLRVSRCVFACNDNEYDDN